MKITKVFFLNGSLSICRSSWLLLSDYIAFALKFNNGCEGQGHDIKRNRKKWIYYFGYKIHFVCLSFLTKRALKHTHNFTEAKRKSIFARESTAICTHMDCFEFHLQTRRNQFVSWMLSIGPILINSTINHFLQMSSFFTDQPYARVICVKFVKLEK